MTAKINPQFKSETASHAYNQMLDDLTDVFKMMEAGAPKRGKAIELIMLQRDAYSRMLEFKRMALQTAYLIDSQQRIMAATIIDISNGDHHD